MANSVQNLLFEYQILAWIKENGYPGKGNNYIGNACAIICYLGSMLFPLKMDPFIVGVWCQGNQTGSHKLLPQ